MRTIRHYAIPRTGLTACGEQSVRQFTTTEVADVTCKNCNRKLAKSAVAVKPQHGGARPGAGWKRDAGKISIGRAEIQSGAKVKAVVMNPDGSLAIAAIFGTLSIHGRQIVVTLDWGETITIEPI